MVSSAKHHRARAALIHGALLALSGCGLLDIDSASKITTIEPLATRVEVVALGPLHPERVYVPSLAPIAEALPGDRVRAQVVVVDREGVPLSDDELDSVWFHCGPGPCRMTQLEPEDPILDQDCATFEAWNTDARCRLGTGTGSIEFDVPPLAEVTVRGGRMVLYAAVAWHGQSAEDCWTALRAQSVIDPRCGFVDFDVALGPYWWMQAYARTQGLPIDRRPELFPAPVFIQQVNRPPVVSAVEIEVDGELREAVSPPPGEFAGPIAVERGDLVRLRVLVDPIEQLSQTYFIPFGRFSGTFTLLPEPMVLRISTAGPVRLDGPDDPPFEYHFPIDVTVDDAAPAGLARVIIVVADVRGAEDFVGLELDIR